MSEQINVEDYNFKALVEAGRRVREAKLKAIASTDDVDHQKAIRKIATKLTHALANLDVGKRGDIYHFNEAALDIVDYFEQYCAGTYTDTPKHLMADIAVLESNEFIARSYMNRFYQAIRRASIKVAEDDHYMAGCVRMIGFTDDEVRQIRAEYKNNPTYNTTRRMASEWGCHRHTIGDCVHYKSYKNVKD